MMCSPFIRITGLAPNIAWILSQIERSGDLPLSVQLMGNHPQHLASAAAALSAAGVEVVDLNLGCPSRQVCRKAAGSALLSDIDAIARIVEALRKACSCLLSVKMRASEQAETATTEATAQDTLRVAASIEAAGADFLVLHPRTRQQGYTGIANWDLVRLVKSRLRIPVVGNGDCWYAADAVRMMQACGADAVMIGRPALRNPYLFRQIRELMLGVVPYRPTGQDIVRYVEALAAQLEGAWKLTRRGPEGALKEHIQYLLRAIPAEPRAALWLSTRQAASVKDVIEAVRPLNEVGELDLAADGPLRLETCPSLPATPN
jgi:tRNA-dihydrouridine synthase